MLNSKNSPLDYVAVELAVKLHEILGDNDSYLYEYVPEASEIVGRIAAQDKKTNIAEVIADVFSNALEFTYEPSTFTEAAALLNNRLQILKEFTQLS